MPSFDLSVCWFTLSPGTGCLACLARAHCRTCRVPCAAPSDDRLRHRHSSCSSEFSGHAVGASLPVTLRAWHEQTAFSRVTLPLPVQVPLEDVPSVATMLPLVSLGCIAHHCSFPLGAPRWIRPCQGSLQTEAVACVCRPTRRRAANCAPTPSSDSGCRSSWRAKPWIATTWCAWSAYGNTLRFRYHRSVWHVIPTSAAWQSSGRDTSFVLLPKSPGITVREAGGYD